MGYLCDAEASATCIWRGKITLSDTFQPRAWSEILSYGRVQTKFAGGAEHSKLPVAQTFLSVLLLAQARMSVPPQN